MGRPERALDPEDSPLAQFAADLRRVRERAGKPTYRAMSRLVHRSQTTMSEAAGGRTVPTWETVEAFLRPAVSRTSTSGADAGSAFLTPPLRRWNSLSRSPRTPTARCAAKCYWPSLPPRYSWPQG